LAKAQFTNLTNIEELFSAIDIGDLIGSFGNRPPASIAELRRAIVVFITRTIEETITVPHTATSITPPGDYDMLTKLVQAKIKKTAGLGRNDISFTVRNSCLRDPPPVNASSANALTHGAREGARAKCSPASNTGR
jgi:hypothetical protein